jgi:hypothetical protein
MTKWFAVVALPLLGERAGVRAVILAVRHRVGAQIRF